MSSKNPAIAITMDTYRDAETDITFHTFDITFAEFIGEAEAEIGPELLVIGEMFVNRNTLN